MLPYKKNPFIGSLRHMPTRPSGYRGLFDLLPPAAQLQHAILTGDETLSPVKQVTVLTRSQFMHLKDFSATLPAPASLAPRPVVLTQDVKQAVVRDMESWAYQMGQAMLRRS